MSPLFLILRIAVQRYSKVETHPDAIPMLKFATSIQHCSKLNIGHVFEYSAILYESRFNTAAGQESENLSVVRACAQRVREDKHWKKLSENLTQWKAATSHVRVVNGYYFLLSGAAFYRLSFRRGRRYVGGVYTIVQRNPIVV